MVTGGCWLVAGWRATTGWDFSSTGYYFQHRLFSAGLL